MYSEKSSTGNNIMDLSNRQLMLIRDSLIRASHECTLEQEEKAELHDILKVVLSVFNEK